MIVTWRQGVGGEDGGRKSEETSVRVTKFSEIQSNPELMQKDINPPKGTITTAAVSKKAPGAERKRKFHNKTKNGCKTCKKRRVRCDETRPSCIRCLSLNKVCEGYEPPQIWMFEPRRKSTSDIPSRGLFRPESSPEESRAIQFFHENTKPVLSNFNSAADHFWRYVVPQVGQQHDAIRHQVVATGSVHELSFGRSNSANTEYFASRYYGKALHELSTGSPPPAHVMLMSCLLSIALETIRTGSEASTMHLANGLRILREWKVCKDSMVSKASSSTDELITMWIEPIFAQLEATASLTGIANIPHEITPPQQLAWRTPILPPLFPNLLTAREKFFEICQWLHFQGLRDPLSHIAGNVHLQETMELWTEFYQKFLALWKTIPQDDGRAQLQSRLLDVHYRAHLVTLQAQSLPMETAWDDWVEEHKQHVDVCTSILESEEAYHVDRNPVSLDFEFDPGLLPPVWQVAVSCRDSVTRHRALDLLRAHHKKCGHEDDCAAAVCAETVVHLEEADLLDPASSTCNDIPEHSRIRLLEFDFSELGKMVVTYTRSPYYVQETTVVPFFTLSNPPPWPFKAWPLAETVRMAGYQGLLRPRATGCRCKGCGTM